MANVQWDPKKHADDKASRAANDFALDVGIVLSVDGDEGHTAVVQTTTVDRDGTIGGGPSVVPATMSVPGDVNVPEEGSQVIIGYIRGQRPVILGSLYSGGRGLPTYAEGDRIATHAPGFVTQKFLASGKYELEVEQSGDGTTTITIERSGRVLVDNGGGTVEITSSGDVNVDGGDVTINGSSLGAIYDIDTTKDGDGHVTDITLNRRTNTFI